MPVQRWSPDPVRPGLIKVNVGGREAVKLSAECMNAGHGDPMET